MSKKAPALYCEIRRKLHEIGMERTFKLGLRKLVREMFNLDLFKRKDLHPFDLKYGTDTSGLIKPEALDIPCDKAAHAIRYQTAIVEVFLEILNYLPVSYEEFFFIDTGSGKGRALLLASMFPFKRIIGIELSANLHKIACQNIQVYKDELQQCHKIQSICEDAADYQIPDEKIIFYLFNPFDEYVMCAVLSNIENSFRRYQRDIYIAYLKPVYRNVFDQAAFLEVFKQTERYIIYKSKLLTVS